MTEGARELIDSPEPPPREEEGPILVDTMDRKGLPMCKPNPDQRPTPDKPGKRKMALVTASLSVDPYERRGAEEIADRLVNEKPKTQRFKVRGYFMNNRDRMQYATHPAMGLPIAGGLIDGRCWNLSNDRMERSGMRWSTEGAEAMVNLRGLFLTDLWDPFRNYRIEREKKLLYGRNQSDETIPAAAENPAKAAPKSTN